MYGLYIKISTATLFIIKKNRKESECLTIICYVMLWGTQNDLRKHCTALKIFMKSHNDQKYTYEIVVSREKKNNILNCMKLCPHLTNFCICCCCSVTKSCPTLCDPMDCSMPGLPVLLYLPELAQTHVHWVSDAIQPSNLLLYPFLLTLSFSQNQNYAHI